MYQQNLILYPVKEDAISLFYRIENNKIYFDTFYNIFNVYVLKKYTDSRTLIVEADYDSSISLEIIYESKNEKRVLQTNEVNTNKFLIELDALPSDGFIYLVFGTNDISKIHNVSYITDAPSRNIKPSIIFTTYNREEFLVKNLNSLKTIVNDLHKVIIINNGNEISLDRKVFSLETFIVIPSANIGGTGGFTRGMIEAKKLNSTHLFIMDDDITLEPEVVKKALSLISCLSEKHANDWLGFSMFPLDKPYIQYELGTKWNGIKMFINHHNLDLSLKRNLIKNQINEKYNYSAWWSLLMPVSVLDRYGYPFPFFIKFDDIEYGMRRKGEEIILSNGFGVWHENFDKKYNPYLEYYLLRNAFVTNALHLKNPTLLSLVRFICKSIKSYFKGQFVELKLMRIAVDDFLKESDYFVNLDLCEKNNEIRKIASTKFNILSSILLNPFLVIYYCFKILFRYHPTSKTFIRNKDYLTGSDYWGKMFSLWE